MSKVRAKFVITHVENHAGGDMRIHGRPVHSGSEENKSFNDYTPDGKLELHISKDKPAQKLFEPGKEYYLDIIPVEEA